MPDYVNVLVNVVVILGVTKRVATTTPANNVSCYSAVAHIVTEACATRLCSHTFSVGLILEPREVRIVTSSMLTPCQTNRPKSAFTSMGMKVTYKCRLVGLSLLALAVFAHM